MPGPGVPGLGGNVRVPRSIVGRLVGALALGGAISLALLAGWLTAREAAELDAAARAELRQLGRALEVSFGNALRDRQMVDVAEVLERLEQVDRDLDVYVIGQDGSLRAASAGALPASDFALAAAGRALAHGGPLVEDVAHPSGPRLVYATPLRDPGEPVAGGAVVVGRPLDDVRADLRGTWLTLAGGLALVLSAQVGLGFGLGQAVVGRPLQALVHAIDRVAEGAEDARLAPEGSSELAEVALRFNRMLDELGRTRAELVRIEDERRQLLEAVQRADKLASVGQLSATVAHEIGSPLQTLVGAAEWLVEDPGDPVRTRQQATRIAEQGQRIAGIVRQLLDVARRRPAERDAELGEAVRSVVDLLGVVARRKGVRLEVDVTGRGRVAAPGALQQVVLNLAQNALHWTPSGGLVRVDIAFGAWTDAAGRARDAVRVRVEDSGAGVPAEIRGRIFEPFFTTREAEGGTGLGLAIVRGLCRDRGGEVTHTGSSTFVAVLPNGGGAA